MEKVTEKPPRTYYPWDTLKEVGDKFKTESMTARQLVYARNKANERMGKPERYKAYKFDSVYVVERTI